MLRDAIYKQLNFVDELWGNREGCKTNAAVSTSTRKAPDEAYT